jgi:branched-chain amino acid transport system permease protein
MKNTVEKLQSKIDLTFWMLVPALIILPLITPHISVATDILIMAIFATGYNILLGYTGLLSFGHASFFGLGAYGSGLLMVKLQVPWPLAIMGGIVVAGLGGVIIGFLSLRRSDVYFALLTLAFSQILYFLALQMRKLTGGDDGLYGVPVMHVTASINLTQPVPIYVFALIIFVAVTYVARRLLNAPFGKTVQAIRENEDRAIACGYHTQSIKLIVFVISALYGGLAGALHAIHLRFVPLETFYWLLNGEVIFVNIVGGLGTFFGPFVGSTVFILLRDYMMRVLERWELVVGIILILFILFFTVGIVGAVERVIASYREKRAAGAAKP